MPGVSGARVAGERCSLLPSARADRELSSGLCQGTMRGFLPARRPPGNESPVRVQEVAPRETAGGILRGRKAARSSALGDPAEMLSAPATAVPDTGPTLQMECSVSVQHPSFSHAASANTARASAATQTLG